jgi:hypothetical protein
LVEELMVCEMLVLRRLETDLGRHFPLTQIICRAAQRAGLNGATVAAHVRTSSILQKHAVLVRRDTSSKPVEFSHEGWITQSRGMSIPDYEVVREKIHKLESFFEMAECPLAASLDNPEIVTVVMAFSAEPRQISRVHKDV